MSANHYKITGIMLIMFSGLIFAHGADVNFDGAKVVYLDENHHLQKIDESGVVSPVFTSEVEVASIYSGSDSNLFLVFQTPQRMDDGSDYILAKAITTNNFLAGIDKDLAGLSADNSLSPALQQDNTGNLYYAGSLTQSPDKTTLRRCATGGNNTNIVSLLNDNITLLQWLVQPDGTLLLNGETKSTGVRWLRKLTNGSNFTTVAMNVSAAWLRTFPDNRVYAGIAASLPYCGVYQLPEDLSAIDAYTPYIGITNGYAPQFGVDEIVKGHSADYTRGFVTSAGANISQTLTMTDGHVVMLAGGAGTRQTLVQYYPASPAVLEPALIDSPSLIQNFRHLLLIAGTRNNANKLVLYDVNTADEISLLEEDIEIYHLVSMYEGYVWFDGLRMSDNRYIVGKFQLSIYPGVQARLVSIGAFNPVALLSGKPLNLIGVNSNPASSIPPSPDPSPDPQAVNPVIRINDSESEQVTLGRNEACRVIVALTAGDYAGQNADWWLAAHAGDSWFNYSLDQGWLDVAGELTPVYQGPLFDLSTTTVLETADLPAGTYTFYFGTDDEMNGLLGADRLTYDTVRLTIE